MFYRIKIQSFFIIFLGSFCLILNFYGLKAAKKTDYISSAVHDEIENQLELLVTNSLEAKQEVGKYDKDIEREVKKEIRRQSLKNTKDKVKNRVYDGNGTKWNKLYDGDYIYKVPSWPFYGLFYAQKDIFQIDLSFDFATQAYSSGGGTQDLSRLVFGEKNIEVQDILLASRLLKEEKLYPARRTLPYDKHYLYILADQPLLFDASSTKQTVNLSYARHFHKGDISLGFMLPFARRENKLKFNSKIDSQTQKQLEDATVAGVNPVTPAGPNFYGLYTDLEAFFNAILAEKDITYDYHDTEVGIGDFSAFINFEFYSKRCERLVTGFHFLFPTARKKDIYKLWDPELGNGGFTQISAFASLLLGQNRFLNPYFFAEVIFSLPANVSRRIPKLKSYDGTTICQRGDKVGNDFMIFGDLVLYKDPFENEPDADVRNFADTAKKIKIKPGMEFFFKAGNMFERFLFRKAFLDVFYDLRVKGRDYIGFRMDSDEYYNSILTQNTSRIEHRIGLDLSYQFDENYRARIGGTYSFAGRNVERTVGFYLTLNIEF